MIVLFGVENSLELYIVSWLQEVEAKRGERADNGLKEVIKAPTMASGTMETVWWRICSSSRLCRVGMLRSTPSSPRRCSLEAATAEW